MNPISKHKEILEEIKACIERKRELRAAYSAESKRLEELLNTEKELDQQIKKESLFVSMNTDETV